LSVATVKQDTVKSAKEDRLEEKPKTCVNQFGMDNEKFTCKADKNLRAYLLSKSEECEARELGDRIRVYINMERVK
jgi:hypothetical protein